VEQADMHTRTRNLAIQQKLDPPNIVAAKLPPDKPTCGLPWSEEICL
jgi:hypothetical protein